MGCWAVECPFNPGRGCGPAVMTRLAGAASGRGLASELPLPSRQAGLRRHPPCSLHPPSSGGQRLEQESGTHTRPSTPLLREPRWVQPPPPTSPSPSAVSTSFHLASFSSSPSSLPSTIHGSCVAALLHKWVPSHLGDGLWAGRYLTPQGGAARVLSTVSAGPFFGFVLVCGMGPGAVARLSSPPCRACRKDQDAACRAQGARPPGAASSGSGRPWPQGRQRVKCPPQGCLPPAATSHTGLSAF